MVSSDYFNRHDEWWFDTEEAARKKKSRAARHAGHEVGGEDEGRQMRQDMMWHERPENAGKVGRLKKMYRNTKNDEIMLKLDISLSMLHRTARALGLTKTKRFMRGCQRDTAARARESHIVNGTGRKPKAEKTGAQSDPVGDDWMFGKMGSKGLFVTRR